MSRLVAEDIGFGQGWNSPSHTRTCLVVFVGISPRGVYYCFIIVVNEKINCPSKFSLRVIISVKRLMLIIETSNEAIQFYLHFC